MHHPARVSEVMFARLPVLVDVPPEMREPVEEVLAGEYEPGFFGSGLTILDIGANVGSFTLWANLRWPGSVIHAYEPHPGTFRFLERNTKGLANVHLHNVAVYPSAQRRLPLLTRYDGDGESGLADCMKTTFVPDLPGSQLVDVDVVAPAALPRADIVKLDVEGAEAAILDALPLMGIELILLEYQNDTTRAAIKRRLAHEFVLEFEDAFPWDGLLDYRGYRADLAGNHYGRMFFARPHCRRLVKGCAPRPQPRDPGCETPARDDAPSTSRWRAALAHLLPGARNRARRSWV